MPYAGIVHRGLRARECLVAQDYTVKVSGFQATRVLQDKEVRLCVCVCVETGEQEGRVDSTESQCVLPDTVCVCVSCSTTGLRKGTRFRCAG